MTRELTRNELEILLLEESPLAIRARYGSRLGQDGLELLPRYEALQLDLDGLHENLNAMEPKAPNFEPPAAWFPPKQAWWQRVFSMPAWALPLPAIAGAILAFTASWFWLANPDPTPGFRGQTITDSRVTLPPDPSREPLDRALREALVARANYLLSKNNPDDYLAALHDLERAYALGKDRELLSLLIRTCEALGMSDRAQSYRDQNPPKMPSP